MDINCDKFIIPETYDNGGLDKKSPRNKKPIDDVIDMMKDIKNDIDIIKDDLIIIKAWINRGWIFN